MQKKSAMFSLLTYIILMEKKDSNNTAMYYVFYIQKMRMKKIKRAMFLRKNYNFLYINVIIKKIRVKEYNFYIFIYIK